MMTRHIRTVGGLVILLIIGLSGCKQNGSKSIAPAATPTIGATAIPQPLATPYALQPAAGICASFEGEMVTINLNIDISDPRCSKVTADQKLTVINQTLSTLQVSIGSFNSNLLPGGTYTVDVPFGDYLEEGVHQLQVSPCCSAELWLEGK
jgi:type 1 fimbria pilin